MPVYLIRAGGSDLVKIGWAKDVERRRKWLQPGCPFRLRVIRTMDGPPALERWMHRHFRSTRQFGEWFVFQPEMLTVCIEDVRPAPKADPKMPPELRARIAQSMRASWRDGSLRKTHEMQRHNARAA